MKSIIIYIFIADSFVNEIFGYNLFQLKPLLDYGFDSEISGGTL
jgi:hypothetical protein